MTDDVRPRPEQVILDPDLPIVDAHHHLFDRPGLPYMLEAFRKDAQSGHNIIASVYVETQAFVRTDGPEILRPIGEIEFANGAGAISDSGAYGSLRACAGIVGYADLRQGDEVGRLLDLAMQVAPERFKGVRQIAIEAAAEAGSKMIHIPPSGVLQAAGFRSGFSQLGSRGLTFDAAVFHHQLGDIGDLADAFPGTTIVLNHVGIPMAMDLDADGRAEIFVHWQRGVSEVSRRANVVCKVGGLGMAFTGFGFDQRSEPIGYTELAAAWAPYVETVVEMFGVDRCMMESNFPIDRRSCGYVTLWNAMKHITRHYSLDDRAALFHGTATRVYRLTEQWGRA